MQFYGMFYMLLRLERYKSNNNATLGKLFINDNFECFTCEDAYHEQKIYGKTRIPSGQYEIKLHNEGTMTLKYAQKFPNIHKGMLEIQNIPNYSNVYIHIGNKNEDTLGCILVGELVDENNFIVKQSTLAYLHIYPVITKALEIEQVFIKIIDQDIIK